MACQQTFLRELRTHGFRLTPQREMVLSVLHDMEGHVSAEEVHSRVYAISPAVDISTVYRTLDLLQEFGLVTSIVPGDGHRRFELLAVHGPHIHLVCTHCKCVIGIPIETAQALADQTLAQHGFTADLGQLSLSGLCAACREGNTQRR